jgi:hypothetical protein
MEKESKRVIKDGKVAVCYSPGFGVGWSTWEDDEFKETLMFHPAIVHMVLENKTHLINEQWIINNLGEKYANIALSNLDTLDIEWVPQGSLIRINEYDGSEEIEIYDENSYIKV